MSSPTLPRAPRYMPPLDAWNAAAERPPAGLDGGLLLAALVKYAILAPSAHNTQPWRFTIAGDTLSLHADRTRALPVSDPHHRELVIGCGAALGMLRIAAQAVGRAVVVERLPEAREPDLLARVVLGAAVSPTARDLALFEAIPRRHTARHRYVREPLPPLVVADLVAAAHAEGAWLAVLADARRDAFVALVAEGERLQAADEAFQRELAAWVHPDRSAHRDGMPDYACNTGGLARTSGGAATRLVDWCDPQADADHDYAMGAPVLAMLGSDADDPAAWLRTGEALARVLLVATAHGLRHAYLNQPMEVAALRPRAAALVPDAGIPQLGLRFGIGTDVLPTPRRAVAEVLRVEGR